MLAIAVILVAVSLPLIFWRSVPRRPGTCGSCGYRLEALERMLCPECGHDLRYYGIRPTTLTILNARTSAVLCWTMAALLVVYDVGFMRSFAGLQDPPVRVTATWRDDAGAVPPVMLVASSEARLGEPGTVVLTIEGVDGDPRELSMTEDGGSVRSRVSGLVGRGPLVAPTIEELDEQRRSLRRSLTLWLEGAGYSPETAPGVADALRDLELLTGSALRSPEQLDTAVFLLSSTLTIESAEGTYAVTLNRPPFLQDPAALGRLGVVVLIVLPIWLAGFVLLRRLLRGHERRVRSAGTGLAGESVGTGA